MHWTNHLPVAGYNITRPFPFRWFTVILVVEFTIAIVLFSLISFVTSGYQLGSEYSSDPNSTVVQRNIRGVPDFLLRLKPTCESVEVAVGESFTTNNSALTYLVNRVEQQGSISPAFGYHLNPLTECQITDVLILIDTTTRNAAQLAFMDYGADISASVNCSLVADGIPTTLNFTASYSYVPSTVAIDTRLAAFPGRNISTKASLFWGEELLAFYWSVMVNKYRNEFVNQSVVNTYTKAALYLVPNKTHESNITASWFFGATHRLYGNKKDGAPSILWSGDNLSPVELSNYRYSRTTGEVFRPTFWVYADSLAKSFHSTIMTDLGQIHFQPNILTDSNLLQNFTAEIPRFRNTLGFSENHNAGLLLNASTRVRNDYNSLKQTTGPLSVKPSVILARYLCQVPRLKSTGNLIISFLITNIVLLQTLWAVTMWVATWLTNRRDRNSSYCMRCESIQQEDSIELGRNPKKSTYSMILDQEPEEIRGLLSPRGKHKPYLSPSVR